MFDSENEANLLLQKSMVGMQLHTEYAGIIDYASLYAFTVPKTEMEEELVLISTAIEMWRAENQPQLPVKMNVSLPLEISTQQLASNYILSFPCIKMPLISQVNLRKKPKTQQQDKTIQNFSMWVKAKRQVNDYMFYYSKEMIFPDYNLVVHILNLLRTLNFYIRDELSGAFLAGEFTPVNIEEFLFGSLAVGFLPFTLNIQKNLQSAVDLLNRLLIQLKRNVVEYKQADETAQAECKQSLAELQVVISKLQEYCKIYVYHHDGQFTKQSFVNIAKALVVVLKDVIEKLRQAKMNVHFISLDAAYKGQNSHIYRSPNEVMVIMAQHERREFENDLFYKLIQNDIVKKEELKFPIKNLTVTPFLERRHGA